MHQTLLCFNTIIKRFNNTLPFNHLKSKVEISNSKTIVCNMKTLLCLSFFNLLMLPTLSRLFVIKIKCAGKKYTLFE